MKKFSSIVVLTGAGLSAESGVSTFRDPAGIWAKYDWRDVATPEGFARDPAAVHEFYNMRRRLHRDVKPNAAHFALARLDHAHGGVTLSRRTSMRCMKPLARRLSFTCTARP